LTRSLSVFNSYEIMGCANKLCRRRRRPSYWGVEKLKEGKQAYALIRQREPQWLKKVQTS